jgi:hypothetical protein
VIGSVSLIFGGLGYKEITVGRLLASEPLKSYLIPVYELIVWKGIEIKLARGWNYHPSFRRGLTNILGYPIVVGLLL